jgi:hypothetical protein
MADKAEKPHLVPPDNPPSEQAAPNPFDPERLRINLDPTDGIGVKKITNTSRCVSRTSKTTSGCTLIRLSGSPLPSSNCVPIRRRSW